MKARIHTHPGYGLCACGCGQTTKLAPSTDSRRGWVKGAPMKFLLGHVGKMKAGTGKGYVSARRSKQARGYEHRLIAEAALGKPLPAGAQVHHVDGDRGNNATTNLVICQDQKYHGLLHRRTRVVKAGGNPNTHDVCNKCKALRAIGDFCRTNERHGRSTVCRTCKSEYDKRRRLERSAA